MFEFKERNKLDISILSVVKLRRWSDALNQGDLNQKSKSKSFCNDFKKDFDLNHFFKGIFFLDFDLNLLYERFYWDFKIPPCKIFVFNFSNYFSNQQFSVAVPNK